MSGVRSRRARIVLIAIIVILVMLLFSAAYYAKVSLFGSPASTSTTTKMSTHSASPMSSLDVTFTFNFAYWITVNYSGSWKLFYWGWNGTLVGQFSCASSIHRFCLTPYNATQDNVHGNMAGSGSYTFLVTTYGPGPNILCANATKLGQSKNNLTLTLTVLSTVSSTTASDPTAVACATYGGA